MASPKAAIPKVRLNLDLHPEVKLELIALAERIKADSMSEAMRRAVLVLARILDEQEKGNVLLLKSPSGETREVFFI